jgi:hypothetical protein
MTFASRSRGKLGAKCSSLMTAGNQPPDVARSQGPHPGHCGTPSSRRLIRCVNKSAAVRGAAGSRPTTDATRIGNPARRMAWPVLRRTTRLTFSLESGPPAAVDPARRRHGSLRTTLLHSDRAALDWVGNARGARIAADLATGEVPPLSASGSRNQAAVVIQPLPKVLPAGLTITQVQSRLAGVVAFVGSICVEHDELTSVDRRVVGLELRRHGLGRVQHELGHRERPVAHRSGRRPRRGLSRAQRSLIVYFRGARRGSRQHGSEV